MASISTAVGQERISKVVGYQLTKGFFQEVTPNLPQRIAIFAEVNTANQPGLDLNKKEVTSATEAGELYGFGSPIHNIMRILRPPTGGGIGGIPTVVYPQAEDGGATAATEVITVTGPATANGTHSVVVAGRKGIDGDLYTFNVVDGDDSTAIAVKIKDAINAVLASPVLASNVTGVVTLTAKWKGVTGDDITASVDTGGDSLGVVYVISAGAAGAGVADISGALAQFGNTWNTLIVNSYGEPKHDELEAFNGIPDPDVPTGRYVGIVFLPFLALWGSIEDDKDVLAAITDAKKLEVTNVLCPAPKSDGLPWEAAANGALLAGRIMQDSPHLDVQGKSYPDMPAPEDGDIGDMSDYENRDFLVKKGSSTVDLVAGVYQIKDFVTTYHPDGEIPPQFRYARNLMLDFNVRFAYFLLEQINVVDHAIADDDAPLSVDDVIKPKQWKQIINALADDLGLRNLIVETQFMKDSIVVGTSGTNPDRLETFFRYKRSPYIRIASTTAQAGFSFGLEA